MDPITVEFRSPGMPDSGDLVCLLGEDLAAPAALGAARGPVEALLRRAAASERFKAKWQTALALPAPEGLPGIDRLVAIGIGGDRAKADWLTLGGFLAGKVAGRSATVLGDLGEDAARAAAAMALGARLRGYRFDRYKTKKEEAEGERATAIALALGDPEAARVADAGQEGLATGVNWARDLVNEPPNVLFPAEFARRLEALRDLGVEVEILDEAALAAIGMRALLAVGQGSSHGSRVVLMRWNGGGEAAPLAFVGKGVCFDSGGISIKPAGGMEDMKGDMAGAACVAGLMHALASRGAKANIVGAVGLTENMPDGAAQRPGDIITTLSGQTVEMVNSDAEGRLVLGDVLWYVNDRFKPAFMIDLATLTGAIILALGHDHAGLFANDDTLAGRLLAAGEATGEKVWRMPLGAAYDKLIDSKFADMKNTGGRPGGAITAAQFLKRYVKETSWAHLDIAGTGFSVPSTETNQSWGPGWGVRLLDRLVREHYEARG